MRNDVFATLKTMLTFDQMMFCPTDTNEKIQVERLGFFGSHCWARTSDIMINSHALCHIARYITKKLTRLVFLCHEVLYRFFAEKLCKRGI